jgi:aspartyl-tRNA(Asn)/glutamyl-tRNA(Gln) amidotransferase subunit B
MGELYAWLDAEPDLDEEAREQGKAKIAKLVSGWLLSKLLGLMMERKIAVQTLKITPENFAEFITLLMKGAITGPNGLKILEKMLDDGIDPSHAVEELGAKRIDDADALTSIVQTVIESNPQEVERFKAGDEKLMQFFVGQIMKETRGNADPGLAARAIKDALR